MPAKGKRKEKKNNTHAPSRISVDVSRVKEELDVAKKDLLDLKESNFVSIDS